jgi:hypothetical protein
MGRARKVAGLGWRAGLPLLLCLAGCREKVSFEGVPVVCQRYAGAGMIPVGPGSRYLKTIEDWRKRIDGIAPTLGEVATRCPIVENTSPRGLRFEYHTAWDDTAAGNAVLYYFAFIPHPKVYAGYGIHAVIDAREGRLRKICAFPVPLE